jgi:cyclopropane-fatty-acyl-phospholipid synthase
MAPPTSSPDVSPDRSPRPRRPAGARGWLARAERRALERTLSSRGVLPFPVVLWNGLELSPSSGASRGRVRLLERSALRDLLLRPDPGLGEAYEDGRLIVEGDLLQLVDSAFRTGFGSVGFWRRLLRALAWKPRGSRWRARQNIHHHYDVGNDFYRLWLDERLVYTCAYFPTPDASLEEAQLAKMHHVCRKLDLRPGERVVEGGCGWGALALHMAEHCGARVRAFNISREQIDFACEEAKRRGLSSRVEFVEDDYRGIRERCDAFVSVGMLEHVGRSHYRALSRVVDRCLEPHGRGLLHSIGRAQPKAMSPWLERRIFPGAYIPSLREMMEVFEPANLAVLDVENLRLHYARTLEHWLDRFEKASDRVESMFDARFVRTWRLYLASSIASFRSGNCQLYQVLFSRAGNERIPWTRAGVYGSAPTGGG